MKIYRVGIIGAGQIAGGYDDLNSEDVLTHAHAFNDNPQIDFIGFYDINSNKAKEMAKKWETKFFDKLDLLLNRVDIVSICTPDETHGDIIIKVLNYNIKAIILEKPVAVEISEAKKILKLSKNRNIPILINYPRPYNKHFIKIRERYINHEFGNFLTANFSYGKGLKHNGTHMINLIEFILKDKMKIVNKYDKIIDFKDEDPTVSFSFKICDKIGYAHGIDSRLYTIGECVLFFEKAKIDINDAGFKISMREVKENKIFKGYYSLADSNTENTGYNKYMKDVVENLLDVLEGVNEEIVSLEEGVHLIEVCES